MSKNIDTRIDLFKDSSEQSEDYAIDRASILEELVVAAIQKPGIFLLTGSSYAGREGFLDLLKKNLILKGCSVFSASNVFSSFSDYVYHCLQQQSQGDHSTLGKLPLKSDGTNLFFDGSQLTLFIIDQANLYTDDILLEILKTVVGASSKGYPIGLILADEFLLNERLKKLNYLDAITSAHIIPALNPVVVRDYIDHAMTFAGEECANYVFSPGSIREIADLAKGDICKVNKLCRDSLKRAMKSEDQIVTVHMVKESSSGQFFKLHNHETVRPSPQRKQIKGVAWLSFIPRKLRENAFLSTAALLPLILGTFYIKSVIDEQEKVKVLAKRSQEVIASTEKLTELTGDTLNTGIGQTLPDNSVGRVANDAPQMKMSKQPDFDRVSDSEMTTTGSLKSTLNSPPSIANSESITALVNIEPASAKPLTVLSKIRGNEDSVILLQIGLAESPENEHRYIEIGGVIDGATLSGGTQYGDVWVVKPEELKGLAMIPSVNADYDYHLTVQMKELAKHTVLDEGVIDVKIQAVADKPFMSFSGATGDQYTAIPIEITSRLADTDGSESLSIEINGLPDTVNISAGKKVKSGIWVLTPAELDGLILTPTDGSPDKLDLLIMAIASEQENGSRAVVSGTLNISIIHASQ